MHFPFDESIKNNTNISGKFPKMARFVYMERKWVCLLNSDTFTMHQNEFLPKRFDAFVNIKAWKMNKLTESFKRPVSKYHFDVPSFLRT